MWILLKKENKLSELNGRRGTGMVSGVWERLGVRMTMNGVASLALTRDMGQGRFQGVYQGDPRCNSHHQGKKSLKKSPPYSQGFQWRKGNINLHTKLSTQNLSCIQDMQG